MSPEFDPNAAALANGIFGLPYTPDESKVVLVPAPWEATVSYGAGTAGAPAAILRHCNLERADVGTIMNCYLDFFGLFGFQESARPSFNMCRD